MRRRWAFVLLAVALPLIGALPAAAQLRSSSPAWRTAGQRDWSIGQRSSLSIASDGALVLSADAPPARPGLGSFRQIGIFDSPLHLTAPMRRVQVDFTANTPSDGDLLVLVRLRDTADRWSEWSEARPGQIIRFDRIGQALQYRAVLLGNAASPALRSVTLTPQVLSVDDAEVAALQDRVAPTYLIRGTREGLVGNRTANGHRVVWMDRFVSLPSWRSLSSLNGWEYSVRLTNPVNGRSAIAPVWDVGPWNRHDDYWNDNREWYKDLPKGWPEDHAAFYEGYNRGYAEVSGRVLWPAAVDVGDGTWVEDLGIAYKNEQAPLYITFLWQGRDPGPATGKQTKPVRPDVAPPTHPDAPPPPAPVSVPGEVIVDDLGAGFSSSDATWYEFACGHGNHAWWTYSTTNARNGTNHATWRPALATAGSYDVYVYVPYCRNGKKDTRDARYEVVHADGVEVVSLNQAARAGDWVRLGRWAFAAGDAGSVKLSDVGGDNMRSVWFDAIKWVPAP